MSTKLSAGSEKMIATNDTPNNSNPTTNNNSYEIARLLKLPENRLCADCSAPLFGITSTFASLEFGVWICTACAEMHKEELGSLRQSSPWLVPKPAHSVWTKEEFQRMTRFSSTKSSNTNNANNPGSNVVSTTNTSAITTYGNVSMNKILERYIPNHVWQKITPTSGTGLRRTWIRAKYYSHYFSIPHYDLEQDISNRFMQSDNQSVHSVATIMTATNNSNNSKDDRKARIDAQKVLPTRLIDYFLILGPTKLQLSTTSSSSFQSDSSSTTNTNNTASKLTWTDLSFTADVLDCYPGNNYYADTPIPDLIAPMIFPGGAKLSSVEKQPYSFTYVLTDINRIKLYGASLIIYELVDPTTLQTFLQKHLDTLSASTTTTNSEIKEGLKLLLQTCHQQVLYLPKALTILSHYPFHTLFQSYLARVYHISLSTSPVPLERYIINMVQEVPLPPQGKIEVLFSLPGMLFSISRPPVNQLPMVDFSYRPLFAALSLDHILQIFACLALERPVCICASNVALLTPIQEALLSFLFPFVWQGCYVPILPTHLSELLDAPVPLLVGMHDEYLTQTPPHCRPSGVLFVHVDTDTLMFGERDMDYLQDEDEDNAYSSDPYGAELGRKLPALPKAQATKLRAKLLEHGSHLYKQCDWLLKQAGNPFPHQEHYTPIEHHHFQEQGFIYANSSNANNNANNANNSKSNDFWAMKGIRGNPSSSSAAANSNSSTGTFFTSSSSPNRHPCACTLVTPTGDNNKTNHHQRSNAVTNILDSQNNVIAGDAFNAREIREAFLRFWVASLGEYNDYFAKSNADGTVILSGNSRMPDKRKSLFGSASPAVSTKIDTYVVLKAGMDGVDGVAGEDIFLTNYFAQHLQNLFLSAMIRGQMFSIFRNENLDAKKHSSSTSPSPSLKLKLLNASSRPSFVASSPNSNISTSTVTTGGNTSSSLLDNLSLQPEICFFDEHIQAKRNRSKLTLTKASTPFLADESHFVREIYTVSPPSVNGLDDPHANFSYPAFPNKLGINAPENKGYLIRKPRLLVDKPEVKRWQDDSQAVAFLKQTLITLQQQQRAQQIQNTSGSSSVKDSATSLTLTKQTLDNLKSTSLDNDNNANDPIAFFRHCRLKYLRTIESLTRFQAIVRMRPLYRSYHRQQLALHTLIRFYRAKRIWRLLWKQHVKKESILIQSHIRRYLCQRKYHIQLMLILWLQSKVRQKIQQVWYRKQRKALILFQAYIRGKLTRDMEHFIARDWLRVYREQVVLLWMLEHTSLHYRSLFYKQITEVTYVNLALYQEELTRLYAALHCQTMIPNFPTYVPKNGKSNITTTTSNNNVQIIVPPIRIFREQFEKVNKAFQPLLELQELIKATSKTIGTASISDEDKYNTCMKELRVKIQDITRKYYINNNSGTTGSSSSTKFTALLAQETQQRLQIYDWLKQHESSYNTSSFFKTLHIASRHKRKRKLSNYLWLDLGSVRAIKESANIVLTILPASGETSFWLDQKLAQRVRRHNVETVHACLISLQRVRQAQQQQQQQK